MAVAVQAYDLPKVSPLDALWTLFTTQPKSIQKAFTERILKEDVHAKTLRQQLVVSESLSQAFKELKEAEQTGQELPDAHDLFK